ncbi:hypothetical protein K435DRAFT_964662 [Dendrothele bispora CBS 962.96]|uniref:Uncharacterized protein n=1 Tax=Dendrothele bispora (strain CBS 962.96) TaxID=1314807 RepID=A0A4S8M9D0_DENBC|nr:hypothetical protein K435DRAFT_964662 [Dendrothele bispora CBS 962.96]
MTVIHGRTICILQEPFCSRLKRNSNSLDPLQLAKATMSTPETFDAFVPSTVPDLLSRANFKARYIPLSSLRSLDLENQYKPSYELMRKVDTDAVVNHCLRCYYFSLLILHSGFPSNTPGVRQITRCIMAYEHLLEKYPSPSLSSSDVGDVAQGINASYYSSPTVHLPQRTPPSTISAYFDLAGEIEAAFPRVNVG